MISADVSVKKKSNILYVEKIMLGILIHVLVSVTKIVRLMNISNIALTSKVLLMI